MPPGYGHLYNQDHHTHTVEDGPTSLCGLSQIGCQMLQTAALITAFMNTLPFMFIQTLIYLPQKIKRDRYSLTGPLENWNFSESVLSVRQISAAKITVSLSAGMVIQTSSLTDCACRCVCACVCCLFVLTCFFFLFLSRDGL